MRAKTIAILVGWMLAAGRGAAEEPAVDAGAAAGREPGLVLVVPHDDALFDEPDVVRVRGRGTKTGALVGGVVGGLVLGVLGAGFSSVACEDLCGSEEWIRGGAIGGLVGAAGGAAIGALIGSAVPEGYRVVSVPPPGVSGPPSVPSVPPVRPRGSKATGAIGSASLELGGQRAFGMLAPRGGGGGRLALHMERGKWSMGLEVGRYDLGRRRALSLYGPVVDYSESVVFFGPTATFTLPPYGALRPYVVTAASYYHWLALNPGDLNPRPRRGRPGETPKRIIPGVSDEPVNDRNFFGGSLGSGAQMRITRTLSVGGEARWHTNFSKGELRYPNGTRRLIAATIGAQATLSW